MITAVAACSLSFVKKYLWPFLAFFYWEAPAAELPRLLDSGERDLLNLFSVYILCVFLTVGQSFKSSRYPPSM